MGTSAAEVNGFLGYGAAEVVLVFKKGLLRLTSPEMNGFLFLELVFEGTAESVNVGLISNKLDLTGSAAFLFTSPKRLVFGLASKRVDLLDSRVNFGIEPSEISPSSLSFLSTAFNLFSPPNSEAPAYLLSPPNKDGPPLVKS